VQTEDGSLHAHQPNGWGRRKMEQLNGLTYS